MNIIELELKQLEKILTEEVKTYNNEISDNLINFITAKSKKIRPVLIFLISKALNINISEKIMNIAVSTELIHNATLIHDDIIDNADKRRGNTSLNIQLGNNLSVLAGDLLLSFAMNKLAECENIQILNLYSNSLRKMCMGEINQHFSLYKVPSVDNYIEKSKNKTAELFKAALNSISIIENLKEKENINCFAENFGIAFQIKDDLENIKNIDKSKPTLNDIFNGIYTFPVIILNQKQNVANLSKEEIINTIYNNQDIIEETSKLIKEYAKRAIDSLTFIQDNQYKNELIKLTQKLYEA